MKKIIDSARRYGFLRFKPIALFVLIFFIPMVVSIFIIYKNTIEVVGYDKVKHREKLLIKTANNMGMSLTDMRRAIVPITRNKGVIKILGEIEITTDENMVNFDEFIREKFNEARQQEPYISDYVLIANSGECFYADHGPDRDSSAFFESDLYEKITGEKQDYLWVFDSENIFKNEDSLAFIQKIVTDSGDENGYFVVFIEFEHFEYLYKGVFPNDAGDIVIYNSEFENVFGEDPYDFMAEEVKKLVDSKEFYNSLQLRIGKEGYTVNVVPIRDLNWNAVSVIRTEDIVHSERRSLEGSLWLIITIVLFSGFFMVFSATAISSLITEKEMVNYRLRLAGEMNDKLRMYKHDFMNHLQIIRGLVELDQGERAEKYIESISFEGKLIRDEYELGIPEIEAAIFANTYDLEKHGIEMRVKAVSIEEKLDVDLYDLSRIFINLIKNAVHALKSSSISEKMLSIIITEEPGEYVFEIVNNTPLIPENVRERIFEKGFTTSDNKDGGLGLYIVRKLVEKNRGAIELVVDGDGNHFIFRFGKQK